MKAATARSVRARGGDRRWSGEVTPTAVGYTTFPKARSYVNVTSDLAGQDYSICADTDLSPCQTGIPFDGDEVHDSAQML